MDSKPFYKSKTIWVNGLTVLGSVALTYGVDLGLDEKVRAEIATGIVAIVNVILRLTTVTGVTLK